MKYEYIKSYQNERFRQATGVRPETFLAMTEVLKAAYAERHKKHQGRNRKLAIEDMLLSMLEYYKEYSSYECIATNYGISKQNMCKTIRWVEEVLIKSRLFSLPGKKALSNIGSEIEVILVDTTETPIQRPRKGQKRYYSGKKNDTR